MVDYIEDMLAEMPEATFEGVKMKRDRELQAAHPDFQKKRRQMDEILRSAGNLLTPAQLEQARGHVIAERERVRRIGKETIESRAKLTGKRKKKIR
jgi:hypothetical protein